MRSYLIAAVVTFAVACRSTTGGPPNASAFAPSPAPQDPLAVIARHEEARSDGDGLLQTLALKAEAQSRERACIALGRLSAQEHGKSVTDALVAALSDDVPAVRAAAAFALGQRADRSAASALLAHWDDRDPTVRARIVEAASRIDDARLRQRCLLALQDPDVLVRAEAALAPMRFPPDARVEETALIDFLARDRKDDPERDAEVVWRGLCALARRKSEAARAVFVARASASDVRERIFALQGLAAAGPGEGGRAVLISALSDPSWRAACEAAIALGKHVDLDAIPALDAASRSSNVHVRTAAIGALGSYRDGGDRVDVIVERAHDDPSPNVRAAALVALAQLQGDSFAATVEARRYEKDPVVRAGAARAAAELSSERAVPLLVDFSRDTDLRVAGIAVEGLGKHRTPESRGRLRVLLASSDNGLRLAAVDALKTDAAAEDLPYLARAFEAKGEISAEVAAGVLDAAAKVGNGDANVLLRRGVDHDDPFVRAKARELLAKADPAFRPPPRRPPTASGGLEASVAWKRNPRVELTTTKGTMLFELFPDDAPRHVANFIALVARKHYDGLTFHRVVPDFVIQGGDVRGDGNGGTTFDGRPLRAEFSPRKFVRGALGMPRNDDPDSGGSQIFVTHRDTPHLDGRYTLFGELRDGFDVLDAIEIGDRIVAARVVDDGR